MAFRSKIFGKVIQNHDWTNNTFRLSRAVIILKQKIGRIFGQIDVHTQNFETRNP
jgi:hypothetical protein